MTPIRIRKEDIVYEALQCHFDTAKPGRSGLQCQTPSQNLENFRSETPCFPFGEGLNLNPQCHLTWKLQCQKQFGWPEPWHWANPLAYTGRSPLLITLVRRTLAPFPSVKWDPVDIEVLLHYKQVVENIKLNLYYKETRSRSLSPRPFQGNNKGGLGLSMSLNLRLIFMWSGKPKGDLQVLYLSGAILSPDCVSLVIPKPENDNQCHNVKKSAEEPVNLIDFPTYILERPV